MADCKVCLGCGEKLSPKNFYSTGHGRYLTSRCKKCYGKQQRNSALKRLYGITLEAYEALLEAQDGCCAVCGTRPTKKMSLCVDHDHETGLIRGLLCGSCNKGIGLLGDSVDGLERAIRYLSND